jgi:hypothetical protein
VFAGTGSVALAGKLSRWQFCAFVEPCDRAGAAASVNHGGERFASIEAFVDAVPRLRPVAAVVDLTRPPMGAPGSLRTLAGLRRAHCTSTVALLAGALSAVGTLALFIEVPVELGLRAGGVGLEECLRLLERAGYMTKHAPVNPNAWGTPVDGEKEFIIAMEAGAAAAVDFAAFEVPCEPFAAVKRFRCVKDAMVYGLPANQAKHACLSSPGLRWRVGCAPSAEQLTRVHDSSSPATAVVLGSLDGVDVVSSRGALPGHARCWVFDEALWLKGAYERCLRKLAVGEVLKCFGLEATHSLAPGSLSESARLVHCCSQPRPVVDCLALLQLLLSKHWRRLHCKQPRPGMITTKIQKLTDIVTPKYVKFVQIWQSKYQAAVRAFVQEGREINLPSWVGDFEEFVQPACRFCTWNLMTLQPLKRHRKPCHRITLVPILEFLEGFDDGQIVDLVEYVGASSGACPPWRTVLHPNHKGFYADMEQAWGFVEKEVEFG